MITVKDVAFRAGVPLKTAQRALSGQTLGKRRDARERAEKVLAAAAELGYRPSQIARSLRDGKTRTIGFVVGSITDQYFAAVAETAMDEAERAKYSLLLRLSRWDAGLTLDCVQKFLSSSVDGILFSGQMNEQANPFYRELRKRNYPLLTLSSPNAPGFSSISSDHSVSIPAALQYLAARGQRRVLLSLYKGLDQFSDATGAVFSNSCKALGLEHEVIVNHSLGDVARLVHRKYPAVLLFGKYSLRAFGDELNKMRNYRPDIIGFANEWIWANYPQTRLCGAIFDHAETNIRMAIRFLIQEIEQRTPPQDLSFQSRFIPNECFGELKVKNLANEFLFT